MQQAVGAGAGALGVRGAAEAQQQGQHRPAGQFANHAAAAKTNLLEEGTVGNLARQHLRNLLKIDGLAGKNSSIQLE
ncbi:hypothetical protein GCM10028821_14720 [Hymenobacter jeollabukensis]